MDYYSGYITKLIEELSALPGVGPKTAGRLAFHILDMPSEQVHDLASAIVEAKNNVKYCKICCTLTDQEVCPICSSNQRDHKTIMVVETTKDMAAYEKIGEYKGVYHVLHGAINPMAGIGQNDIKLKDYAEKFGCEFHAGEKPWGVKVDLIMPCATQNDVNMEWAEKIVANGVPYYIEVANMPTTNDALEYLQKNCKVVAPSKAVNAGGVATSALEMSQNSMRYSWTEEEVDAKLKQIMKNIHDMSASAAEEYGLGYDLVAGANIAGFKKVADAMMSEGLI